MFPDSFSQPLFLLATAVFSITGVLAAARQNMDVLGLVIIGMVTAIGGGTLRDMMLDVPVFWLADPTYTIVAAVAAALTFFFERRFRATEQALLENIKAFTDAVSKAKPAGAKGTYVKRVALSSTMGPGVHVDPSTAH